jgi:molybdenum cofactor synthesis domain-containing protein
MPTVAGIIIGNEILTGKFADLNGPHLIARARALGADLRRIVTIADDPDAIADEVARCAASADHVITSGGVGPTHDDVTLEGVARGFGLPLVREPSLESLLTGYGLTTPHALRMAEIPLGSHLIHGEPNRFPVVRCRNVWILPGVPRLFERKLALVEPHLRGELVTARRLVTYDDESGIAARLQAVQDRYPTVDIGSYPRFEGGRAHVILTLESRDVGALERATAELAGLLGVPAPALP